MEARRSETEFAEARVVWYLAAMIRGERFATQFLSRVNGRCPGEKIARLLLLPGSIGFLRADRGGVQPGLWSTARRPTFAREGSHPRCSKHGPA